jgi:hypothetical protein
MAWLLPDVIAPVLSRFVAGRVRRFGANIGYWLSAIDYSERASSESPLVNQGGIAGSSKYCHPDSNEDGSTC